MNKTHRIVWSEARGAFIVAHEFAATSGKRSSTRSVIAQSLAVAALVAAAAPALAQTVPLTNPGQTLNNPAGSTIQGTSGGPGVTVNGVAAGSITNAGTILGVATGEANLLYGIIVGTAGALTGGVTNSGVITGGNIGINITAGSSVSGIVNSGMISGTSVSGIAVIGASVGTISNSASGVISGNTVGVAITNGSSAAGITNAGTITGNSDGVFVSGAGSVLTGVTNSGMISGGIYGVSVEGSSSLGSIINSSTIAGVQAGINVNSGASITSISNTTGGVIQGSGSQAAGVLVNGGTVGSITNAGTISGGASTNTIGVYVQGGGKIGSISNSGLITGTNDAVQVDGTGSTITSITNSGHINSAYSAIAVYDGGAIGSVVNSGTISNVATTSTAFAVGGGTIGSISNSGLITSPRTAINVYNGGSVGSVLNSGTISGGASHDGISIYSASVGSVSNSGAITGAYAGIQVQNSGTLGSLINSGNIAGGLYGVILQSGATLGSLTNSGTLVGQNAGIFLTGSTISGSIVNQSGGVIKSTGTNYFSNGNFFTAPGGIVGNNVNIGSIVNESGGVITGASGIYLQDGTLGSLQNAGAILATSTDYDVALFGLTVGGITNSGTIAGGDIGLFVVGSNVTGGITNSGSIVGQYGAVIEDGTLAGGITNSGLISGTSYTGLIVEEETITGGIHNKSGGVISGASGISLYGTVIDSITNDAGGKIIGTGLQFGSPNQLGAGIAIRSFTTITGNLTNNGLISGYSAGITLNQSGSVIQGSIINAGTVLGTIAGIALNGTASVLDGGVSNSGTIMGGKYGVSILGVSGMTVSGGISNSGLISGTSVAGIYTTATTVAGGITNAASGTISGGVAGVELVGSTLTGGMVNAGKIVGGMTGVAVKSTSAITGGFVNSGTISGSKYAINVDATSSIGPITITGNNTAAFVGDVFALNSPVTVASGTYTGTNAFNVQSFDVATGALFNLTTMASTAGENSGVTVSQGFTNEGTVSVGRGYGVITGDYTQAASGAFGVGVASAANHGVLAISGAANLSPNANIVVDIAANNSLTNKETITGVLTSGALTASTFNVTDNSELISFKGLVDGNNVDLVTSFNALVLPDAIANKNVNAYGAAGVIDQIILGSNGTGPFTGIINDIAKLQTPRQVSNAASQLVPLLSGDNNVATYAALSQMNQVVQSRIEGHYGMSAGSPYTLDQNAWVKPFGSWANLADQNGAPGFSSGVEGVALGGDAAISNAARVGLAFAYANVDVSGNSQHAPNNDRINMYQLMGYGSYAIDPQTEINAQIDGGINTNDGNRTIGFAGTSATSSFNSSDAHFGLGIARSLPLSESTIFTPEVRVDYTWVSADDYSEGGAGPLSLNTKSTSFESLLTQLNGKLTQKLNDNVTMFGNLGIGYDSMAHSNTSIIAAFSGAPGLSFSTQGVGLSPRALLGGIGVVSTPRGNMPELTFRYDVQQRSGFADQSVSFKARWAF